MASSSRSHIFCKIGVKDLGKIHREPTVTGIHFFKKLQAFRVELYLKGDSGTGELPYILRNF